MLLESTQQLLSILNDWEIGGAKLIRDSGRILSEIDDLIAELESREEAAAVRTAHLDDREKLVNESLTELHRLMRSLNNSTDSTESDHPLAADVSESE